MKDVEKEKKNNITLCSFGSLYLKVPVIEYHMLGWTLTFYIRFSIEIQLNCHLLHEAFPNPSQ